jgi:hypothetical protein
VLAALDLPFVAGLILAAAIPLLFFIALLMLTSLAVMRALMRVLATLHRALVRGLVVTATIVFICHGGTPVGNANLLSCNEPHAQWIQGERSGVASTAIQDERACLTSKSRDSGRQGQVPSITFSRISTGRVNGNRNISVRG